MADYSRVEIDFFVQVNCMLNDNYRHRHTSRYLHTFTYLDVHVPSWSLSVGCNMKRLADWFNSVYKSWSRSMGHAFPKYGQTCPQGFKSSVCNAIPPRKGIQYEFNPNTQMKINILMNTGLSFPTLPVHDPISGSDWSVFQWHLHHKTISVSATSISVLDYISNRKLKLWNWRLRTVEAHCFLQRHSEDRPSISNVRFKKRLLLLTLQHTRRIKWP